LGDRKNEHNQAEHWRERVRSRYLPVVPSKSWTTDCSTGHRLGLERDHSTSQTWNLDGIEMSN
jgi:hypothetical protein